MRRGVKRGREPVLRFERQRIDLWCCGQEHLPLEAELYPQGQQRNIDRVAPPCPVAVAMVERGLVAEDPTCNQIAEACL